MEVKGFQAFLEVLSRRFTRQDILLVLDGAPNHRSGELVVPDNISLFLLPPYAPELNPKESLWEEIFPSRPSPISPSHSDLGMVLHTVNLDEAIRQEPRFPKTAAGANSPSQRMER